MPNHLRPYDKPPTKFSEQLDILKSRGMAFSDEEQALHCLRYINYYRLTSYWLPFEEDHETHKFKAGTSFDQVLNLTSLIESSDYY